MKKEVLQAFMKGEKMIEIILGIILIIVTILAIIFLMKPKPQPQQQWNPQFQQPQVAAPSRGASPEEIQMAVKKVCEKKQHERKRFIEEKTRELIEDGKRKLSL